MGITKISIMTFIILNIYIYIYIYINDLDDNITSQVLKFADNIKVFRKVNTDGDKQHLQNHLDRLVKRSEKRQMFSILGSVNAYIQDMGTWM